MTEATSGAGTTALAALRSPFDELLGLAWESVEPQRVVATLVAGDSHHQPFGLVHGGVYATMVETLASVGATLQVDTTRMAVGVHNATDFLRPHTTGRLRAVGEPLHIGRTQQLWQVVITRDGDGAVVARGQVRLAVVPRPAAAPGSGSDDAQSVGGDTRAEPEVEPKRTTRTA